MDEKVEPSNIVKFPDIGGRAAIVGQAIENKGMNRGVAMKKCKTGEELRHMQEVHSTTLGDLLKICRGSIDTRLHQRTLEQKIKVMDEMKRYLHNYGMSLYYPREGDVMRGKEICLEDKVCVYIKESRAGKAMEAILNLRDISSSDGAIQDYGIDDLIRYVGGWLFLPE
jgi:hypothetical protein